MQPPNANYTAMFCRLPLKTRRIRGAWEPPFPLAALTNFRRCNYLRSERRMLYDLSYAV